MLLMSELSISLLRGEKLTICSLNNWQYDASLELSKQGFITVPNFLVQVFIN